MRTGVFVSRGGYRIEMVRFDFARNAGYDSEGRAYDMTFGADRNPWLSADEEANMKAYRRLADQAEKQANERWNNYGRHL